MTKSATDVLIGFNPTIPVPTTAYMFSGNDSIEVPFIPEFKRLSRKDNRLLQKEMVEAMRKIRQLSNELMELEKKRDKDSEKRINEIDAEIDELTELMETRIKNHLVGWKDLKGHGDELVPFSHEAVDILLDNEAYFIALRDALNRATGTDHEAIERKNSSK